MVPANEENLSGKKESTPSNNELAKQPRMVPWKMTPPKGNEAIATPTPAAQHRGSARRRLAGMLWVVLLALLTVALYTTLAPDQSGELPEEVLGTWRTTDPRYAETILEIEKTKLVFGTVDNSSTSHTIERVEQEDLDLATLYIVHYRDEGGLNELSFFYTPIDSVIRFRNQRSMAWRRESVPQDSVPANDGP